MKPKKTFVISLGGSIVVPDKIDWKFLTSFKKFVDARVKKGERIIIVVGGGKTARNYRDAGTAVIRKLPPDDLDWLGIHATRLNAHLMRTIFRADAHIKIITDPTEPINFRKGILIAAGHRPGRSTDYVAVQLAQRYHANELFNLSNIDYVFDKDPGKYKSAKKITAITWTAFRKIVGTKWNPGLNAPFDPVASKLAQAADMRVAVLNGHDLKNLNLAMDGKKFRGTLIENL